MHPCMYINQSYKGLLGVAWSGIYGSGAQISSFLYLNRTIHFGALYSFYDIAKSALLQHAFPVAPFLVSTF